MGAERERDGSFSSPDGEATGAAVSAEPGRAAAAAAAVARGGAWAGSSLGES